MQDGLSAIEVWGTAAGGGGAEGSCETGEDEKDALAAHIEALFGVEEK